MKVIIEKSSPAGTVVAPASKSMSHRLLICAGLSKGKSKIDNIIFSDDIKATLRCLEAIGCRIKAEEMSVTVEGIDGFDCFNGGVLDCGESGSTLRFFIPLCLLSGKRVTFVGSEKLFSRPLDVYFDIFQKQGIKAEITKNSLTIDGRLRADTFEIKGNISSQFISGLMFALPLLKEKSIINIIPPFESRPYAAMTAKALGDFGIKSVFTDSNSIEIKGGQRYKPCSISVEGDWSNAAFFYAFSESGADLNISGTDRDSLQGDKVCAEYFKKLKSGFCVLDLSDCPDLAPIMFSFAAKHGGGKFIGTDRLRFKESDRIRCMKAELEKFGAEVTVGSNEVTVTAKELCKPKGIICGHNDHRIVMSMAYLLTFTGGVLDGVEACNKSYPGFFEELKKAGVKLQYEA